MDKICASPRVLRIFLRATCVFPPSPPPQKKSPIGAKLSSVGFQPYEKCENTLRAVSAQSREREPLGNDGRNAFASKKNFLCLRGFFASFAFEKTFLRVSPRRSARVLAGLCRARALPSARRRADRCPKDRRRAARSCFPASQCSGRRAFSPRRERPSRSRSLFRRSPCTRR